MASSNRNPIRQWSITFPQCGEVSKENFIKSFPPAVAYTCAREPHADGGWHLHLGIKLKKGLSKKALLTWIASRWPDDYMRIDVQATRNIKDWNDYLQKEDPNCLVMVEEEKKFPMPKETWKPMGISVPTRMDGFDELKEFKSSPKEMLFWIQRYYEGYINDEELKEMALKNEWRL